MISTPSNRMNMLPSIPMTQTPEEVLKQFITDVRHLSTSIERVFTEIQNVLSLDTKKIILAPLGDEVIHLNQYITIIMEYGRTYLHHPSSTHQTAIVEDLAEFAHHIREQTSPLGGLIAVYTQYDTEGIPADQRLNVIMQYGRKVIEVLNSFERQHQ